MDPVNAAYAARLRCAFARARAWMLEDPRRSRPLPWRVDTRVRAPSLQARSTSTAASSLHWQIDLRSDRGLAYAAPWGRGTHKSRSCRRRSDALQSDLREEFFT